MNAAKDQSDENVPASERGKGENMPVDRRMQSSVFGLVVLSYFVVLLLMLTGFALWMYL